MLIAGGSTNVTTYFMMRLAADGTAATGLTIANLKLQYVRSGVAPAAMVAATALAAADTAHTDNYAFEIDATDQPGLYRVDWPDAAFAAAVREVILTVVCATCFTENLRVEIDGEVNVVEWAGGDVVAGAIPAFAADAAGGLPISDAGGVDMDVLAADAARLTAARAGVLTDWIDAGRLDVLLDAIKAVTDVIPDAGALTTIAADAARLTAARAAVLTDWIDAGRLDLLLDAIKAVTDAIPEAGALTTISADTARLTAVRAAVLTDWINGGRLDLILDAIAAALTPVPEKAGSVNDAGAAAGDFDGDAGLSASDDFYNGSVLAFTSGALLGIARKITDYTGASRNLVFTTAFPAAPANADTFTILGRID